MVATSTPQITPPSFQYINNTINKKFDCNPNDADIDLLGQFVLYALDTGSGEWKIKNTTSKTKKYGYPYVNYGFSAATQNEEIIIGAPLFATDYYVPDTIYNTVHGYSYIYNIENLNTNYQLGNVFYRNGKFILSNSGSIFENILKNKFDTQYPAYDISYKSQITLYEKQIVCKINPDEFNVSTNPTALKRNIFNFDIDGNNIFDIIDLDLILKYISYTVNNNDMQWQNYIALSDEEYSLINYYYSKFKIPINSMTYLSKYLASLQSAYMIFDIDGNKKISINDGILILKYFFNKITKSEIFKYVDIKSNRKTPESIIQYLDVQTGKNNYGEILPEFLNYKYSSSVDVTGSYLAPYITTVGLYSGLDLVAVAKLGMPIKNSGELPLNIIVKWDI